MFTLFRLLIISALLAVTASARQKIPVDISFQREDITLYGKFFPASVNGPSPTLLLLPGFPGNDNDILGLGKRIADLGINMVMFNYSGTHKSGGLLRMKGVLDDISAALTYLRKIENVERFGIDTANIVLGGYSFGGGMAMTYAVRHPEVKRLVSIAGNDWGEHFEDYVNIPGLKTTLDASIRSSESKGLIRFDEGERPAEFLANGTGNLDSAFYLRRNADLLADRNILLIAGWDDSGVVIERYTLPLYRALKEQGAKHVKLVAFQDNHAFRNSRDEIAQTIVGWINH